MPYKRVGNKVYVKKKGRWMPKATAESVDGAKKIIRILKKAEFGPDIRRKP